MKKSRRIRSRKIRRSKHARTNKRRRNRRTGRRIKGGGIPNYPSGYTQFENNKPISTSYSTGGPLSPASSALANPTPIDQVKNNAIDNLNHYAKNSFGISGSGSGFPSRGWF